MRNSKNKTGTNRYRKDKYIAYPEQSEPVYCAKFGCAKKLSIHEQVLGKYCIPHQQQINQLKNEQDSGIHL